MKASIIVCTKDRENALKRFLASLKRQTRLPDEVVIVDASSNKKTQKLIDKKVKKLPFKVIYKKTQPGSARQRNIGFQLSQGDCLFFFDDDVVLDSDYIGVIDETFKKYSESTIGGMTGRITNIPQIRRLDKNFRKFFFLSDQGQGIIKLSGFPSIRTDLEPSLVGVLSGCNMIYKREVFSQFLFDENLKGYSYMEDVDLSYRAGKKYALLYQPAAKLKHYSTAEKIYDSRALRKMMIQNHRYLFKKNLPKDLKHIQCHWISIAGVFLYNAIVLRDIKACKGIIEGLLKPLEC